MTRRAGRKTSPGSSHEAGKVPMLNELDEALLAVAGRPIDVRSGGVTRTVSFHEALVLKIGEKALGGSPHAQRNLADLIAAATEKRNQKVEMETALWRSFQARAREKIARAKAEGRPEPEIWPHPDDLAFDDIKGVTLTGPLNDDEARVCQKRRDLVIACLRQGVLEERLDGYGLTGKEDGPLYTAEIMAYENNACLPRRLQLSDVQITMLMLRFHQLPKRQLLADCHRDWKRLGWKLKRGQRLMPLAQYKAVHDWTLPLAKRLIELGKDWREADRAILESLPAFQEIAEIPRETWTEASKDWRRLMGVQI